MCLTMDWKNILMLRKKRGRDIKHIASQESSLFVLFNQYNNPKNLRGKPSLTVPKEGPEEANIHFLWRHVVRQPDNPKKRQGLKQSGPRQMAKAPGL